MLGSSIFGSQISLIKSLLLVLRPPTTLPKGPYALGRAEETTNTSPLGFLIIVNVLYDVIAHKPYHCVLYFGVPYILYLYYVISQKPYYNILSLGVPYCNYTKRPVYCSSWPGHLRSFGLGCFPKRTTRTPNYGP